MSNFKDLIDGETPVLVDFFATWCGPCKAMAPELDKLAKTMSTDLKVIKVDVDRNQSAASKYQIRSVPTLILFAKGKILWRISGTKSASELSRMIKEAVAKSN
jgi:thioredoxin 1